jgi:hypothetical protein
LVYQPRVPGLEVSRAYPSKITDLGKCDFDRQGAPKFGLRFANHFHFYSQSHQFPRLLSNPFNTAKNDVLALPTALFARLTACSFLHRLRDISISKGWV